MTKDELEAIRQRAEAATEGEWCEGYDHYVLIDNFKGSYQTFGVARCARKEDTEFIAHARQDIPALLDHIAEIDRKLRKAELIIGRVEDLLSSIQHGTGYEVYDEVYRFIYEEGDENADDR
ncbi:hypothetical protein [Bacillus haynesii]|uniref:hypothetical protein n=1 Tax=Bacillus haynesii TaxID=1925021 RepID=UPI001F600317|nr:hypothetical protein [Bacillus haynesii]MCI4129411.1 hypothetical protein [Bacillus haynesii]